MDLATMRTRVRRDLHDEDAANYRWTDNVLDRHIARAVADVSLVAPVELETTLVTSAGSRDLSLTTLTGRVGVVGVEYPAGEYPPVLPPFEVWGEKLTLLVEDAPSAGQNVIVRWGKLHTLDGAGTTLPDRLHDVVATGAGAFAAIEWANFAVNRINLGGPDAGEQYLVWGEERMREFAKQLERLADTRGGSGDPKREPLPGRRIGIGRLVSVE